jgi:hypothetical protein
MKAKPARPLNEYVNFVRREVFDRSPGEQTRLWADQWASVLEPMARNMNAIFDLISLVIARWEFLGALLQGTTGETSCKEALAYCEKFLDEVNGNYGNVGKLSDQGRGSPFELFAMLRNRPLHGLVPAGVLMRDQQNVVTWWVGLSGISAEAHLTVDDQGGLNVDAGKLAGELVNSMRLFASYLDADAGLVNGRSPRINWQRGFWARYRAVGMGEDEWIKEMGNRRRDCVEQRRGVGANRRIPARRA